MLSQAEIDVLPTIMDVVEQLSKVENDALLRNGVTIFPGDGFQDEGRPITDLRYASLKFCWQHILCSVN